MTSESKGESILISVIIPTFNRPQQLHAVLEQLSSQTLPAAWVEVVVVDDGSAQSYDSVMNDHWPFSLQLARQENRGEIVARIHGIEISRGDFLVFLDDDIFITPNYLRVMYDEHQRHPNAVLMGTLYPKMEQNPLSFQRFMAVEEGSLPSGEISYVECGTGTMAMSRRIYLACGGMRPLGEGGRNAWGGMDLAYRAYQAGFPSRRCREAVAYHDDYAMRDLKTYANRMYKVSRHAVLHFQRTPELSDKVPMFRDKQPIRLGKDPLWLVLRKLARKVASTPFMTKVFENIAQGLNRLFPHSRVSFPLFRWIVGGYIYRGYQQGLNDFGQVEE